MKILKLNFSNLNSLKGDFCIDLSSGSLHEAGIFAICGPTGSGKSTILDAITLALFGKAARYGDGSNVHNMMSRGTGECKASVSFETHDKTYIATWALQRAHKNPDGKFQNVVRTVCDSANNILHEKVKPIDNFIAEQSGLDYKRFLRSVLLAQGQFREFLDAKANVRGELLEKITGTEIYSDLGKHCFYTTKDKNDEIKKLNTQVEHLELLQKPQIQELNQEKQTLNHQIKEIKSQLDMLALQESQYKVLADYHQNEIQIKQKILDLESYLKQEDEATKKIKRHSQTQEFQQELFSLDNKQTQQVESQKELTQFDLKIPKAQTLLHDLKHSLKNYYQKQCHQFDQKLQNKEINIKDFQKSLNQSQASVQDHQALKSLLSELPKIKSIHSEIVEYQSKINQQTSYLKSQKNKLKLLDLESQQVLKDNLNLQNTHQLLSKELEKQETKYQSLTKEHTLLDLQQKLKESHQNDSKIKNLQNQFKGYQNIVHQNDLLQKQLQDAQKLQLKLQSNLKDTDEQFQKEDKLLKEKQQILNLSLKIDSLSKQREQLKPNEECPLCGSLEHPFSQGIEQSLNIDQVEFDQQNKKVQELLQDISTLKAQVSRNLQDIEQFKAEQTTIASTIDDQIKSLQPLLKSLSFQRKDLLQEQFNEDLNHQIQAIATQIPLLETKISQIIEHKDQFDLKKIEFENSTKLLDAKLLSQKQNEKLSLEIQKNIQLAQDQILDLNKNCDQQSQELKQLLNQFNYHYKSDLKNLIQDLDLQILSLQKHQKNIDHLKSQIELVNKDQYHLQEQKSKIEQCLKTIIVDDVPYQEILENSAQDYEKRINDGQQYLSILKEKRQDLELFQKQLLIQIKQESNDLEQKLKASGFLNIEDLKASTLNSIEQKRIQELLDHIKSQSSAIDTLKTQNQQIYLKNKLATIDNDEGASALKQLVQQQTTNKNKIEELNQRLGQISNIFTQDQNKQEQVKSILLAIENLKEKYKDWFMMNSLIGSADGASFSKFAQGLTLQRLIILANQHLFKLNPRYQIQRSSDKELEVEIIDLYQANSVRPTKSLSGGESFLLSLSLALSLSELSSHKNPIKSLFIDEGFGSLDSDTLDLALSALENLRHDQRMIGIISHVEPLKQRIHAKIEVERQSNGNSTIKIT